MRGVGAIDTQDCSEVKKKGDRNKGSMGQMGNLIQKQRGEVGVLNDEEKTIRKAQ